ncbi:hypothetical protein K491DRAFT_322884 [Lophiostoma macrostomum CBS 122681]|uniref:Uncharacterized protein n=1 Tax=Lophiostoma macrostomum CBS 122681 TaxID=1314788 RepID=A0A6A6TCF2_9PLEO|nr:hypothetical protein K491DRAFT_322884 [Lophiostoma macrostomum CBS 122681]
MYRGYHTRSLFGKAWNPSCCVRTVGLQASRYGFLFLTTTLPNGRTPGPLFPSVVGCTHCGRASLETAPGPERRLVRVLEGSGWGPGRYDIRFAVLDAHIARLFSSPSGALGAFPRLRVKTGACAEGWPGGRQLEAPVLSLWSEDGAVLPRQPWSLYRDLPHGAMSSLSPLHQHRPSWRGRLPRASTALRPARSVDKSVASSSIVRLALAGSHPFHLTDHGHALR